jgi:muramidase (phage lysozyme)
MLGVMKDPDASIDSYELNRGRRDADLFAGKLRDAYAQSGLNANDDPKAFEKFVSEQKALMFDGPLKGADPSYYHGFLTRVASSYEDMAQAHAGHLDSFISSQNKLAMQTRIEAKAGVDLAVNKERSAFRTFMDTVSGGEGGTNYNAFHGHGGNQSVRFTDMTIQQVLDWQNSGKWKAAGAGSSAVGRYQFIHDTLKEVVEKSGIDPNTKFTPDIQDKLIMFRLFDKRSLKDYLDGKISDQEMLDNGLAKEFASLKRTNGTGVYDGDGLNKASVSARETLAALQAFKQSYLYDPARVSKTDE